MSPRRLLAITLLAPLGLGGCGAVSTLRTAFEIPVSPTPSPRELARAKETKAYDSLSQSVAKLNADTVRKIFGSTASTTGANSRRQLQPSRLAFQPALSLANDLRRGTDIPLAPQSVAISLQGAREPGYSLLPPLGSGTTRTVPPRRLFSASLGAVGGGLSGTARAFLEAWAARESLRRSDTALLGRRNLEDSIELQSHSELPALDLSLVSPETQLELSNLRLKLIPLLQVPPAQRAQAAAQIEAIEARLSQIWEQETARQAALLQQSLVEIPTRLRREGESVLEAQTRESAAQTQKRLAQVRGDLETRLRLPSVAALNLMQNRAFSPDSGAVRAELSVPLTGASNRPTAASIRVGEGIREITRRGANVSSRVPENIAAKNARLWRAAVN